ncbi:MAG: 16S rRNA processing protein RimM [Lachnospiraceae bacterium]|nr:16S rRNA processing protein RimM [Lachnospiraceae bacterium]
MESFLKVGVISRVHGVRGEVKVFPTTDDVKRFKKCKKLILDTGRERIDLEVEGVKFFKQFVILKFRDHDTIESIERYKGKDLYVTREDAVKLNKDEYFIADLINMHVFDEGDHELGILTDVIETGANDVYAVRDASGRELLIPAIKECILSVDPEKGIMKVHLLPGLTDL